MNMKLSLTNLLLLFSIVVHAQDVPVWGFFKGQANTYSLVPGFNSDMVVDYENNFHIFGGGRIDGDGSN